MVQGSRGQYVPKRPPGSPFNRPEPEAVPDEVYSVDDRVTHDKYGLGRVIAVVESREVTVDFGAQTLRIALPSTKLSRL
ncbi:MAG: hypothetical protein ACT4QG_19550 [Sporichthyaceae bacterium]